MIGDAAAIDEFTRLSRRCPRSTSPTATTAPRRPLAWRRRAAARRAIARLLPERDLPPPRDDDPRLQPRHPRPQRPHAGAAAGRDRRAVSPLRLASPVGRAAATEFGMFLGGRWYRLRLRPRARAARTTRSARLPITLLNRNLIEPILGIADPRTDKRIDFIGGGRGLASSSAGSTRARWRSPSRSIPTAWTT